MSSSTIVKLTTTNNEIISWVNPEDFNPNTQHQDTIILPPRMYKFSEKHDQYLNRIGYMQGSLQHTGTNLEILKNYILEDLKSDKNLKYNKDTNTIHFLDENCKLDNLTPRQAVMLSEYITMNKMTYDYAQLTDKKIAKYNDSLTINESLEQGNGVCRNYADNMSGVFFTLKSIQNKETSLLNNTYMKYVSTNDKYDQNALAGIVIVHNHAWVRITQVTSKNNIIVINIDPTAQDNKKAEKPQDFFMAKVSHGGTLTMEQTESRMIFDLNELKRRNIINEKTLKIVNEQMGSNTNILDSVRYVHKNNDKNFGYSTEELIKEKFENISPNNISVEEYRILNKYIEGYHEVLKRGKSTLSEEDNNKLLPYKLKLASHAVSLLKSGKYFSYKTSAKLMNNLRQATTIKEITDITEEIEDKLKGKTSLESGLSYYDLEEEILEIIDDAKERVIKLKINNNTQVKNTLPTDTKLSN